MGGGEGVRRGLGLGFGAGGWIDAGQYRQVEDRLKVQAELEVVRWVGGWLGIRMGGGAGLWR